MVDESLTSPDSSQQCYEPLHSYQSYPICENSSSQNMESQGPIQPQWSYNTIESHRTQLLCHGYYEHQQNELQKYQNQLPLEIINHEKFSDNCAQNTESKSALFVVLLKIYISWTRCYIAHNWLPS